MVGVSAYQVTKLKTAYSVKQFYPAQHELLKNDQKIRNMFRLNEKSPFLFVIQFDKKDSWLKKENIEKLKELTLNFQDKSSVSQIMTMTSIESAEKTKSDLVIGSLFDTKPTNTWKKLIQKNSFMYPNLIGSDFASTLIVVESKSSDSKTLQKDHDRYLQTIQRQFPKAEIISTGVPRIQSTLSELIKNELSLFLVLVVLIFCGLFFVLFSHWTAVASALLILLSSNLVSLASLVLLNIPMNAVLVTLPIIVSVTVMSLLIHTLHLWSTQQKFDSNSESIWQSSKSTVLQLFLPNFLGSMTTALGFLALAPSNIPIISQYGWVVASQVVLVFLFSQLFLIVTLPFIKPKMRTWFNKEAHWALLPLQHTKVILGSIVLVTLICFATFPFLNFSGKLFNDLPQNNPVRTSMEWIDHSFGGMISYDLRLKAQSVGFWNEPQNLLQLQKLSNHLKSNQQLGSVITITDFFQGDIPRSKASVAETFFLFSLAEKNPLNHFLTENSQNARIALRLKDLESHSMSTQLKWIHESTKYYFPNIQVFESGMASTSHTINQEVSKKLVLGFWESLVLIGAFLIFVFRSFRWAVIACLPNFIPPAFMMGALSLTQTPIKPGIAIIFSIALGFAFNNTVYILSKYKKLLNENHPNPLPEALKQEATPCLFESIIMFLGFSVFIFSDFTVNKTFGAFMMLSVFAGFLADLYFLPAFLNLFSQSKKQETHKEESTPEEVSPVKIAASIALALLMIVPKPSQAKSLTAPEILKKSQLQLDSKDDQAKVVMNIIEKNGETKKRVLILKSKRAETFYVMAKIESPADIKGMGFLGQVRDGQESQWIYLPSSGQVRRVVSGKSKAGLLGSEISPEDLNSQMVKSSQLKSLPDIKNNYQIQVTPSSKDSVYSKIVSLISKDQFLPQKTTYYIKNKAVKTVQFEKYKKIKNIWRAQKIEVKNLKNGRGTVIELSDLKVNTGLQESDFSQSALKED